ncbi:2Fe-2S iron-sulfur cluster-binding protein [Aeromonas diversa]|uniref:Ferredoxin n=1 Tax=Aeromonas diversa CDC 2478-85 TaxID=1268237 RepID=N9VC92_9GAMM|nr:2Fe-2S iron-sulfur cluster-binding protein [Aeromonas diversa]ENY72862.1 ferredoxin [Aeromonas diversa CDC 2478-85]
MPYLKFLKAGVTVHFDTSIRLLELDEHVTFGCRAGNCGACTIRVVEGHQHLSATTPREKRLFTLTGETDPSVRLACQCKAYGDVVLHEIN